MYGISQTVAPSTEAVAIADVRRHVNLGASNTDHDSVLTLLMARARIYCENFTNRQLVSATYALTIDGFPIGREKLYLPKSPIQSITSVAYLDSDGASQTLSSAAYRLTSNRDPGYLTLAYGYNWPTTRAVSDAVTITFVAGYGAIGTVPEAIKQAIMLLIGHWFANRGDNAELQWNTVRWGVHALLDQYRVADDFIAYGPEVLT